MQAGRLYPAHVSARLTLLLLNYSRQGHCIGGLFPADESVGNVYVVFEVLGGCVLLEIVADIHFQLGAGLELLLPVVVGVHVDSNQNVPK